ncbi:mannose-1-phosphate guanylyltransferase/mannose-6-phosphate isomerase [Colwellia sp. 4_MG-2023]|uniref:mannose-1-phosphate guanylyltransferase/mannose-6-phosphate isomerase n=1 Tax=unclassified Colwellia TaxID=196834 RepID=UPI0026E48934|nr:MULTISPECIES: mannose-1-phosphate guanylyltransferase/mannose-6-phosphate isomerase [unclassified Colwellia]MDO6506819.1 mannose-1-phosphate guanylyltransferase/mannose-6-phosphate isomerase [Colwellia sp. 5_MG-2023]MDO6555806.1 mannose-1-phosphate guanylyltransferase/mannose-6-phosphate isomerase [Colwellia sp. 4_MG-2023]
MPKVNATKLSVSPIIMCGGSGTRLWPLSRAQFPKQFLALINDNSMLQETLARLATQYQAPVFICNEDHRFLVAEQVKQVNCSGASILLEPQGRNTAPAVAIAALNALAKGDDALLLVLAADHVINDIKKFHQAIDIACITAEQGALVAFGIVPTHAETGYGYIKQGIKKDAGIYQVARFVEKPTIDKAQSYVESGDYLWNSGMFLFKASRYLEELAKCRPDILTACQEAMANVATDLDFIRPDRDAFLQCANVSIDYAVMEKTDDAVVVPLDAGWSDIGSYSALWEVGQQDSQHNVLKGDVIAHDTHNSYLHSQNKLIATLGVDNLVVIDTPDAVLVADKNKVQNVDVIVNELKALQRPETQLHRAVYRPWGKYDLVDQGERFQVKRITVNSGAKLSLQVHQHRAEHWIIVSGIAKVTLNDEIIILKENQSTYIPIGAVHALENPGLLPLEMIEVQSGSYLGEDDIVRFEDKYGRIK